MKPEWRTSTVTQICAGMRQERDYSAMPILADALQDAGCDDDGLLERLRKGVSEYVEDERVVCRIFSEKTAEAVAWMEQFVRDINYDDYAEDDEGEEVPGSRKQSDTDPHTYEWVIQELGDVLEGGGEVCFGTDAGQDFFYGKDWNRAPEKRREFYRNWSIITGREAPEAAQERVYFRCAC